MWVNISYTNYKSSIDIKKIKGGMYVACQDNIKTV
jgi:hypothetical protein